MIDTRVTPLSWDTELLDSPSPTQLAEAYFDETLKAWVLSHYDDVAAAFRSPCLSPVGPRSRVKAESLDEAARLKMRAEITESLSPGRLDKWREEIDWVSKTILETLLTDRPVELTKEYGRPLCRAIAMTVMGVSKTDVERLMQFAQQVSEAAAEPFDVARAARSKAADSELREYFHARPVPLGDATFVALSQTLPRMLASFWFALLRHPDEWSRLHKEPALIAVTVDELLRYAGLTRILFRMAISDTELNGIRIRTGDRVILRLAAANRDPRRFENPDAVDIGARRKNHVALGLGKHSCVGAPLIRMAVGTATRALVERYAHATLAREVEWNGGSGFRFPDSLYVFLVI